MDGYAWFFVIYVLSIVLVIPLFRKVVIWMGYLDVITLVGYVIVAIMPIVNTIAVVVVFLHQNQNKVIWKAK